MEFAQQIPYTKAESCEQACLLITEAPIMNLRSRFHIQKAESCEQAGS